MNSSNVPNSTRSPAGCQWLPPDQPTSVSLSVSYGVVLVLAVIGNSLAINYARTNSRIKSNVFNLFLICMATADIVDVLFVAPLHWIYFFFGNKWIGGIVGSFTCKFSYFAVDVSIFASVFTLVAITLDRYFAVCYMKYIPLSRVKTRFIIIGIWATSCLLSSIQLYKFQITTFRGQSYCGSFWNNNDPEKAEEAAKYEVTIKFAVSYGIPLVLMIVLYSLIIRKLRMRLHSCAVEANAELQQRIAHQNRPLVEMFITLVIIFAICWFPVHVNHMLIAFDYQTYLCLPTAVPLVFYLLAHANAAINPLLYFIFISGFRKELKKNAKIICGWATKREESSSGLSRLFRSRSPSLRKRNQTYKGNCNNHRQNTTAGQNPENPTPPTPDLLLKPPFSNTAGSTNCGLSIEAEINFIGKNATIQDRPNSFPPLQVERGLEIENMDCSTIQGEPDPSPPLQVERILEIEDIDWLRIQSQPDPSFPLQVESGLGRENMIWILRRKKESLCSSKSLNVDSHVNRGYSIDNNNRNSKSSSLPWKLSTFV